MKQDNRTKKEWIIDNNLQNSFLLQKDLYICRPLLPDKQEVGTADNGDIIYFEENLRSLKERHKGIIGKPDGYNLLYLHGYDRPKRVTREYLKTVKIDYFEGYSEKTITDYILNNPQIYYRLEGKSKKMKKWSMYATEEEKKLVEEFLRKLREMEWSQGKK